jgi:hypothetical protein
MEKIHKSWKPLFDKYKIDLNIIYGKYGKDDNNVFPNKEDLQIAILILNFNVYIKI